METAATCRRFVGRLFSASCLSFARAQPFETQGKPFEAQGKQERWCYSLHDVARAEVARIKRLAPGKTFLLAVIEANAVFAKPPAEVYLFIVDARWEIEQADVQVLNHTSGFEDAIQ